MSSWWIEEPLVLGSSNPATEQLKRLYGEGFRSIISLLDEGEQSPNYDIDGVEAMGYKRYSIPMKDFSAPSLDDFKAFLEAVDRAVGQGKVLVHCYAGIGRTGTMAWPQPIGLTKAYSLMRPSRKVRKSNPSVIPADEQESSLYELEISID